MASCAVAAPQRAFFARRSVAPRAVRARVITMVGPSCSQIAGALPHRTAPAPAGGARPAAAPARCRGPARNASLPWPPRAHPAPARPQAQLSQDELKKQAAWKAVEYVKSGMVVGLGTGSTAAFAVDRIGQLLKDGQLKDIVGVPTSIRTYEQAKSERGRRGGRRGGRAGEAAPEGATAPRCGADVRAAAQGRQLGLACNQQGFRGLRAHVATCREACATHAHMHALGAHDHAASDSAAPCTPHRATTPRCADALPGLVPSLDGCRPGHPSGHARHAAQAGCGH